MLVIYIEYLQKSRAKCFSELLSVQKRVSGVSFSRKRVAGLIYSKIPDNCTLHLFKVLHVDVFQGAVYVVT